MRKITKAMSVFAVMSLSLAVCVSADSIYSTKDDPLVSLSYAEDVLAPQIVQNIMDKVEAEYVHISDVKNTAGGSYECLLLNKNQTLMASSCCELIIIDGKANALITSVSVVSANGGISDLTQGSVVTDGKTVTNSHYLVIPKGDGRGISIVSDSATVLVRGEYSIAG